MILLFGRIADPIIASLTVQLAARSTDLMVIDPAHAPVDEAVEWESDGNALLGFLRIDRRAIDASSIGSMYVREIGWAVTGATGGQTPGGSRARAESLWAFIEAYGGLVINRRIAGCTNASKPYQLELIRKQGFHVPQTLVTTDPEAARLFWEEFGGAVIYKSLSAERSIVKRMTVADIGRLGLLHTCPLQLQEFIPGVDVRVHVVGERIFATEIRSEAADYRYAERVGAGREMRPIDLPPDVAARCVTLTKSLGLVVAGVDLRRAADGEYYCFEANPSPAFLWFEDMTGQRIGEAIVELLCRGTVWN